MMLQSSACRVRRLSAGRTELSDVLINCPACQRSISDRARYCPGCGAAAKGHATPPLAGPMAGATTPVSRRWPLRFMFGLALCLALTDLMMVAALVGGDRWFGLGEQPQEFASSDGRIVLTLSTNWESSPNIAPQAVLCARQAARDMTIIVFVLEKSTLGADVSQDIMRLGELLFERMRRTMQGGHVQNLHSSPTDEFPTARAVVDGINNGTDVTCLYTLVETPTAYYQVQGFTSTRHFQRNVAELSQIASTFRLAP